MNPRTPVVIHGCSPSCEGHGVFLNSPVNANSKGSEQVEVRKYEISAQLYTWHHMPRNVEATTDRAAFEVVEVTPEMAEAGAWVLHAYRPEYDPTRATVAEIYRAMAKARS